MDPFAILYSISYYVAHLTPPAGFRQVGARGASARSGKDDDADLSPPLQANNLKRQRVADEVKLKVGHLSKSLVSRLLS